MNLSAKQCIETKNFKIAYENWQNTNKRWKNHWFECCVTIFESVPKLAKQYVIDKVNKTIEKARKVINKVRCDRNPNIIWNCEQIKYPKNTQLFYLVRGVDENENLIFSKVGTTTRTINKRMSEELVEYNSLGVRKMIVDKVYDCGDVVAECYESWFRAKYIMKYGSDKFKKNDRFFGVEFDLNEADEIFAECKNL